MLITSCFNHKVSSYLFEIEFRGILVVIKSISTDLLKLGSLIVKIFIKFMAYYVRVARWKSSL
jgi:hypothetical protein